MSILKSKKLSIVTVSVLTAGLVGCQVPTTLDDNTTSTNITQPSSTSQPSRSHQKPVIVPNQTFTLDLNSNNKRFIGYVKYSGKKLTGSKIISGNEDGAFRFVPVGPNYNKLRYVSPNRAKAKTYTLRVVLIDENGASKPQTIKIRLTDGQPPKKDIILPKIVPNQTFTLDLNSNNKRFIGYVKYSGKKLTGSKIISGNEDGAFRFVPVGPNYNKLRYISPNRAKAKTYTLRVVLIDENGASKPQTIKIRLRGNSAPKDSTPPTITLKGSKNISITQYSSFIDPGATVKDNIDKNIKLNISGSVNTSKVGKYTIRYSATDQAGNKTTLTRVVTVIKKIALPDKAIYVDGPGGKGLKNGGNDYNDGRTISKPLRTISKANQIAKPGDTIIVRGGVYNEQIRPSRSGQKGKPITYQGYNSELPTINTKNPIKINKRSYIVVDGFKLYSSVDTYRAAVRFDGTHNKLINSQIINPAVKPGNPENRSDYRADNFPEFGLVVAKSKFNTLQNNIISGWRQGLGAGGAEDLVVKNNIIAGNIHTEIDIGPRPGRESKNDSRLLRQLYEKNIIGASLTSDGIQTESGTPGVINVRGIVIRDNIFYFNAENALDFKSGGDILIEGNLFVATLGDNDGMGVRNTSTGNSVERAGTITRGSSRESERIIIRKNVFYDNAAGISTKDIHWKVYNNTIVANNRDAYGPNSNFDINPKGVIPRQSVPQSFLGISMSSNSGTVVLNNIIIDNKHGMIRLINYGGKDRVIDHNLYANSYGSVKFIVGRNLEAKAFNFDKWKSYLKSISTISGNDSNSFIADPKFINVPRNAEAGFPFFKFKQSDVYNPVYPIVLKFSDLASKLPYNFKLKANSPAIDAGGFLTKTTNSASNSKTLRVKDAKLFFDGYSIIGESGDTIKIGSSAPVKISSINYDKNTITLSSPRSWSRGDNVSLNYSGKSPDIGAFEYGM